MRVKDEFYRWILITSIVTAVFATAMTIVAGIDAGLTALVVLVPTSVLVAVFKALDTMV